MTDTIWAATMLEIERLRKENAELIKENAELVKEHAMLEAATKGK